MKHFPIVLFLLSLAISQVKGQNLITIVYESDGFKLPADIMETLPAWNSEIKKKYRYSLTIGNGISRFSQDSVYAVSLPYGHSYGEFWSFMHIYKDYKNDLYIKSSGLYKTGYAVEKKLSTTIERRTYNWQITQDTSIIAGVACVKAVSENGKITVYYAPGLPYSDGPGEGLFGLPGVVLSFEAPHTSYIAQDVFTQEGIIEIPEFKTVISESTIELSIDEMKKLGPERLLIIRGDSPTGVWLKLE